LKEGEILEIDRHKFKVGKVASVGEMASLFYGTCIEGKHAGKAVRADKTCLPLLVLLPLPCLTRAIPPGKQAAVELSLSLSDLQSGRVQF